MNKKFIILIIFLIIFLLGVSGGLWFYLRKKPVLVPNVVNNYRECVALGYPVQESYPQRCVLPDGRFFTQEIGNELEKKDLIRVSNPRPNQIVQSPLIIEGEARGNWFFEASFPIRIYDDDNNELGVAIAQAQEEWMTENFVPFKAELKFSAPSAASGYLILEKDNPSDLKEHDDSLNIPISFGRVVSPSN